VGERVLQLKLRRPNRAKAQHLDALQAEYTDCVQFHLQAIERLGTTSATVLHRTVYEEARKRFTLKAAMLQRARDKAIEAARSHRARLRQNRKATVPKINGHLPIGLATRVFRLFPERSVLRVSINDGYLWLPLEIPDMFRPLLQKPQAASELVKRGKDWYLHLTIRDEDVPVAEGERPVFGLDLGLANVAVLVGPGTVRFFDGKLLRYTRGRYFKYRQALQKKHKVGMIKRSKGKESRWVCDMNHKISREIIDTVAAAGGVLMIERLTGIRDRSHLSKKVNRMVHAWPFAQLITFLKYKAALIGVPVVEVDPHQTSTTCSRCGHVDRRNRSKQAWFKCKACGYQIHADLNAAVNVAYKSLPDGYTSSGASRLARLLNGAIQLRLSDNHNLASSV
jgi:IS605 OrfB family transposase